jgi:hypothetical protein
VTRGGGRGRRHDVDMRREGGEDKLCKKKIKKKRVFEKKSFPNGI